MTSIDSGNKSMLQAGPCCSKKIMILEEKEGRHQRLATDDELSDFLDELSRLVNFTVFLNLTPRQKSECDKLKNNDRTKERQKYVNLFLASKVK
ncbi:hypothetical protein AKJ16_DCAP24247 [Drosera capensis]